MTPQEAQDELSFGISPYKMYERANQHLRATGSTLSNIGGFEYLGGLRGFLDPRCEEWKIIDITEKIRYLNILAEINIDLGVMATIFANWYRDKPSLQYKLDSVAYAMIEYLHAGYKLPPSLVQILEFVQIAFITDQNVIQCWCMGLDSLREEMSKHGG